MSKKIIYFLFVLLCTILSFRASTISAAGGSGSFAELSECYYEENGVKSPKPDCPDGYDCVKQTQRYSYASGKQFGQANTKVFGRCRKTGTHSDKSQGVKCYEEINGDVTRHESCLFNMYCDIGDEKNIGLDGPNIKMRSGRCAPTTGCGLLNAACQGSSSNGGCCKGGSCWTDNKCRQELYREEGQSCNWLGQSLCSPENICSNHVCVKKDPDALENYAVPGFNCGDARNPDTKKCCFDKNRSKTTMRDSVKASLSKGRWCIFFGIALCVHDGVDAVFDLLEDTQTGKQLIDNYESVHNLKVKACVVGDAYIGKDPVKSEADWSNPDCYCNPTVEGEKICRSYLANKPAELQSCISCFKGIAPYSAPGIWTGIGCVYTNFSDFIGKTLFGIGIGFAGMIAFFCILYAGYTLQTSAGNPEKIKKAQEMLTSCIIGLLLIIFSVFILRVIGVDILRIPGFI